MNPILSILRYRWRSFSRWAAAHGFEIFALGPVILGGGLWVLDRQLGQLRAPIARALEADAGALGSPGRTSLVLALLLVAVALPPTLRQLYDPRRMDRYLDALPIAPSHRFHASLAIELARSLPTLGVLLLAAGALADDLLPAPAVLAERSARLAAALATLALVRFAATLVTVRFRLHGGGRWLLVGGALAAAVVAPFPALRLLRLPWLAPAAQFEAVALEALETAPRTVAPWGASWVLAGTALALYLVCRALYLAWHRRDLEVAGRLIGSGQGRRRLFGSLPGTPLAVQIGRDLTLILRRFSPAVYLSAGLALVIDAVVLTLLLDSRLPELWRERIAVAGLTLSVLAVTALVPFLLKHELPRFWIEKSTGVELERIWKTKLWTAGLLAAVPLTAGIVMLAAAPGLTPAARGLAILQLTAGAWIVASILGLAVFEIAAQPLLGLVFGSLLSLALAGLFVFYPGAWWMWAALYVYIAAQIAARATRRVRLVETEP